MPETIHLPDPLIILPWEDPVLDRGCHDPRTDYVERFWTAVLGPTAVLFLRRTAWLFELCPDGVEVTAEHEARALGICGADGSAGHFRRVVARTADYRLARVAGGHLLVRRRLPPLGPRMVARLPEGLRADHDAWVHRRGDDARADAQRRAQHLALSLFDLGEGPGAVDAQLASWRFDDLTRRAAVTWAWDEHHRRRASLGGDAA